MPENRTTLDFSDSYGTKEFERIKRGLIPQAMEDKWFIFYEEPWLYFHRSWTGTCIFAVRFAPSKRSASVTEAWANREIQLYKETRNDYDCALLKFLIEAFLLGKRVAFPVPGDLAVSLPAGAYQHSVVGRAYPETSLETSSLSLFRRLRRLFGGGRST